VSSSSDDIFGEDDEDGEDSDEDGDTNHGVIGREEKAPPPKRQSSERFTDDKLADEHIRSTSRKYYCKNHCLANLGIRGVREEREKYFRQKSQDRSLSLQWLINREGDEEDKWARTHFRIQGGIVCREAFKSVFCVGNDRILRITRKRNRSLAFDTPAGRPKELQGFLITCWLEDFFKTRVESLPNKDVLHLPDNYTKREVWKLFTSQYGERDQGSKCSYRHFVRVWSSQFSHVKIPPVNRFSACADCEYFKTMRDKAVTDAEKSKRFNFLDLLISFCFLSS
jgi:hypothetical protein